MLKAIQASAYHKEGAFTKVLAYTNDIKIDLAVRKRFTIFVLLVHAPNHHRVSDDDRHGIGWRPQACAQEFRGLNPAQKEILRVCYKGPRKCSA